MILLKLKLRRRMLAAEREVEDVDVALLEEDVEEVAEELVDPDDKKKRFSDSINSFFYRKCVTSCDCITIIVVYDLNTCSMV